ncbi:putative membrane protein YdjJ [Kushneria pakistanensis]|uniref:Membrane protein YdjJ n=2 Tax=Kushneria pakistanensis TaxID=1508770 RepID=A0ABQ3FBV0_9GAMM|nr:putative membrane protein YdjJ [Kushneria pakistanensis]
MLVAHDAIRTTLSASNSGPLTKRLTSTLWFMLLLLHRRGRGHAILAAAGVWITISLIAFWMLMAWLGWFLLFCSDPQAVVNATSKTTADLVERAYYAGYTLTTLGYGDYVPGNNHWRIVPGLAAANGFFLFTAAITYILNVVANVTQKRQLALAMTALGQTPHQMLETTADDGAFTTLASQLQQVQSSIGTVGQQHLAFPILHYYHGETGDKALPLAMTRLYQTLALVCFACPGLDTSTRSQLLIAQRNLDRFLETLSTDFIQPSRHMPDIPDLDAYAQLPGVQKSATEMQEHLASLDHQRLLLAYVRKDGWEWQDVWKTPTT